MADRRELLLEAGMALASELSLPIVLQRIIDLAAELTDARYGALGVIGPEGGIAEFITTGITPEERRRLGPIPQGHGIVGLLIREARPLRLPDLMTDPRAHGFPPHHPPMHTFLGAPIKAMGRVFGNIYLTEKRGGGEFTESDESDLLVLAAQAGVAIANASLYQEARHREQWLGAIRQVTESLLAGHAVEATLTLICRLAVELADADLSTLLLPAAPGRLRVAAGHGEGIDELLDTEFPVDGSLAGAVVREGQAVIVASAVDDPRAHAPTVARGSMGPVMVVPLPREGQAVAALLVGRRVGREPFPAGALEPVEGFARQAAVALDYAEAREAAGRVALLDERERIAKELHDGIIQSLFAVGMGLQGTAMMAPPDLGERIESAVGEIDRVIRDLRNYIFGLRPGILADRQLDQALRALAGDFEQRSGVPTEVEIDARTAAELSGVAAEVVQLAREALSNVSRHAEAHSVAVRLTRNRRHAVLEVIDDGRGFDEATITPGQGLGNLRERTSRAGGRLELVSAPGQGTRLRVELPL